MKLQRFLSTVLLYIFGTLSSWSGAVDVTSLYLTNAGFDTPSSKNE